jgi:hypothetical protein
MLQIDLLASAHNHDKDGFLRRIRFCPSCGTRRLEPSNRDKDPQGKAIQGSEFWCSLCGFSFNLRASIEWNLALRLTKEHRQLRAGVQFKETQIDPMVAKRWKQVFERPVFRPASTWNLGDKLKAALGL